MPYYLQIVIISVICCFLGFCLEPTYALDSDDSEQILRLVFTADYTIPMSTTYFIQDDGASYFTSALQSVDTLDSFTYMGFNFVNSKSWEYLYDITIANSTNMAQLNSTIISAIQPSLASMIQALPTVNETITISGVSTQVSPMQNQCLPLTVTSNVTNVTSFQYPCGQDYCMLCDSLQPCSSNSDCMYKTRCQDNMCSMLLNAATGHFLQNRQIGLLTISTTLIVFALCFVVHLV